MKHKLMLLILLILFSTVVPAACNSGTTGGEMPGTGTPGVETATEVETITLERQPCFGFCPVYTLTIHGDGQVEYDGLNHVEVTGPQTAAIDPAAVQQLGEAMIAAGYLDWEDAYMNQDVTDMPYVITSLTLADGTTKRIEHYYGDHSAPEELTEVESMIDETAGVAQWVGEQE